MEGLHAKCVIDGDLPGVERQFLLIRHSLGAIGTAAIVCNVAVSAALRWSRCMSSWRLGPTAP